MTDDAKSNVRVLAAGAEKVPPRAEEKGAEGPGRGNWFVRRIAPLVAGLALAVPVVPLVNSACADNTTHVEDAESVDGGMEADSEDGTEDVEDSVLPDAEDREASDSDVAEPEVDGDVGSDTEEDGYADSEAEADCPVTLVGDPEEVPAPWLIGESEQRIFETPEVTRGCDGSEITNIVKTEIFLLVPLSDAQLQRAVEQGAYTRALGDDVMITNLSTSIICYGKRIPGAEGWVRPGESITDGIWTIILERFLRDSAMIRAEAPGMPTDLMYLFPGEAGPLSDGKAVIATQMDIYSEICYLSILENIVCGIDGGGGLIKVNMDLSEGRLLRITLERI